SVYRASHLRVRAESQPEGASAPLACDAIPFSEPPELVFPSAIQGDAGDVIRIQHSRPPPPRLAAGMIFASHPARSGKRRQAPIHPAPGDPRETLLPYRDRRPVDELSLV
ncbi:hypothetical protein LTR94_029917, partial [Friedmanniomyces endolithicus]